MTTATGRRRSLRAAVWRFTASITAILTATAVWRSSWAGGSAWICRRWRSTALEPDGARELMRTNYVKYAVADLNKDGKRELTVLRANQDGEGVADCYVSKNGALTLRSSVLVSMTMAELSQQGKGHRGYAAVQRPRPVHHRRGGRCAGHYGRTGSPGRRTDKSGAFRHYRRFPERCPGSVPCIPWTSTATALQRCPAR